MVSESEVKAWVEKNIKAILCLEGEAAPPNLTFSLDDDVRPLTEGDAFSIGYIATFKHGSDVASTVAGAQEPLFLGFAATAKEVKVEFMVAGKSGIPASLEFHHPQQPVFVYWDRLGALQQIGVRATGRPLLR